MTSPAGLARSTGPAVRRPADRTPRRAPLQLVPTPRVDAPRAPFVAVLTSLLLLGLLGLLMLNTVLARDAFALHSLKSEVRALSDSEQALEREVEALRSPQAIAASAAALGMVQSGPPAFLRLSDGAVLGAVDGAAPAVAPTAALPAPATAVAPAAGSVDEADTAPADESDGAAR
jgi:hypothetical protein